MLERSASEVTLSDQAGLLGVSRSSLYYVSCPPSDWEVRVKHRIDAIYTEQPFYGSRRIQFLLEEEGFAIGRDAVRKFMREMGITAIYPKPNTSQPAPENKIYPYLLRGVTSAYPNHIWGIDITYIVRHEVACRIVMRSIPDMTGCPITRTLRGNAAR
jgi:putative transposase